MSDVNTSAEGTTVPKKVNYHKVTLENNTKAFLNDNINGTSVYLGGEDKNGKVVIQAKAPVRNAITGKAIKGSNQLLLQNFFEKNKIKNREVITFDQAEKIGCRVKKEAKNLNITITAVYDKEKKSWNQNVIREFPVSEVFSFDEKGTPRNPKGEIALAKLNAERFTKINRNRALLHNEKIDEAKKTQLLTSIVYEHKKAIEFLSVTNGDINAYKEKSIQEEEKKILSDIMPEGSQIPTLDQQKGRAVEEVKRNDEYIASHKSETPVIDATNTTSPVDYLGKYLAACELGAEFVTDKDSQKTVQDTITANMNNALEKNDYDYLQTFGSECSERCKSVMSEFRSKSFEQQRGIKQERTVVQERPEQTVDAITF